MLRRGRFWIGLAVSAVFVGMLLFSVDLPQMAQALRQANYIWVIPAIAVYFVSVAVRTVRYRYIVRSVRDVSSAALFPVLVIGYMANNLLPMRIGELVRAYVLSERHQVAKMAALGTVAVERLFDGLTLLGFLSVTVLVFGGEGLLTDLALVAAPVFGAALVVFIFALVAPDTAERLVDIFSRVLPGRFRARARALAWSFVEGLRSLRHPDAFAWVAATSVTAWLLEAVVYMLVGRAFGWQIGFGFYIMAVGAGNLAITAPSSQGGIGPFEFLVKAVMVLAGAPEAQAAAYSFAVHAVILVPASLLGLYYLWSMNLSLGRLQRGAAAEEPVTAERVMA